MNTAALARISRSVDLHARDRAKLLQGITKDLHRSAPRTGENTNRFGEKRSRPGGPPAPETGALFALLDQGREKVAPGHYRVPVNVAPLEYGATLANGGQILPRPLGRLALTEFRQAILSTPPKRR